MVDLEDIIDGQCVCVTGGSGFIGSHLAEVLSKHNEVRVIDDFSTGKRENLKGLEVQLTRGSILDPELLQEIFEGVDYVFHEAALPSVQGSLKDPVSSNVVNVDGTLNVLVAARDARVKKLVFASSSSVYGDSPTLPKVETLPPMPLSPYAVSKLTGEHYCRVFWAEYGLPTVALRYFNVYGPRQNLELQYAAVIPNFISSVKAGKPLVIFGDGNQTRDFVYVLDAVQATLLSAAKPESNGEVFNVASGEKITINQLAQVVLRKTGVENSIRYCPRRKGDVLHSQANIEKIGRLGYSPRFPIQQGIENTVLAMIQ